MAVGKRTLAAVDHGELPLQSFLTYRLARLNAMLNRQAGRILNQHGPLKIPEWRILSLLAAHGELNGRRIGEITGLDAGLASRTLFALEQRGLTACSRRADDRRTLWACLTPAGSDLHARIRPLMQARQERLLAALSPEERVGIFRMVDKLMTSVAGELEMDNHP
jgi:DNA-binding MarR family transcriptional regulator